MFKILRFRMAIKQTIIQLLLVCNCPFAVSQEPQKSAGAYSAGVGESRVKENSGEDVLIATQAVAVKISVRLMKKIHEMEKVASEIGGEDDAALERIGEKLSKKIAALVLNRELFTVIKDKRVDWRVRYLLIVYKRYPDKYPNEFVGIMRDKNEQERIRAASALVLLDVSRKDAAVKQAITEVAKSSDTPGEVLKAVMAVAGYGGVDDADVLIKLTERAPANINEVGINLNAVRALGKSKDPAAIGYLIKIFDESAPDSFYQVTAIQQFGVLMEDNSASAMLRPLIVPRLLKLLDDRSYLGCSRDEAAELLAKMNVAEAVDPILKWFLPVNKIDAVAGGGGNNMDIYTGADVLVKLGDKRAIPVLEQMISNFAQDSRWRWSKDRMAERGQKLPDDHQDYKHLKKCLEAIKKQK